MRARLAIAIVATLVAGTWLAGSGSSAPQTGGVTLTPIGSYATGVFFNGDVGAAEIPAYDWLTRRVYVVNAVQQRIDVLDIRNPSAPTKLFHIDVADLGTPNSVDTFLGVIAVAVEAPVRTDPGKVAFFSPNGTRLGTVGVGALPDMLTFSPNGRYLLVANEGEAGATDPQGTVSIIDFDRWPRHVTVDTADFTAFDDDTLDPSVIIAAGKLPSVDLEPEYITVSEDSRRAWVTLQDANAIAELDLRQGRVRALRGLGFKDHGSVRNALDTSDRDNAINQCRWTNVLGMYQPDAIGSFRHHGRTYLLTANEGDSRAADEARVSALTLDPAVFPALWRQNFNLGRLTVNRTLGLQGAAHTKLYVYGARSFSIWSDSGAQVFDSGDQLERITAAFPGGPAPAPPLVLQPPVPPAPASTCPREAAASPAPPGTTPFNSNHEESNSFDTRSDNKGPEPEGVVIGDHFGHTYAFVGLERAGGVAAYDVTNPGAPQFKTYVNTRDFNQPVSIGGLPNPAAGDLGPEGLTFVPFWQSPTFRPLVVVSNEVSGTTTVYELRTS